MTSGTRIADNVPIGTWAKPRGTYSQEQSLPEEGLLGTYLGKTAHENPPVPLNPLFPEDSASTNSDEDLAAELDEFLRFMIWNDVSGKEEEENSSFIEDEEREGYDIITDDSDDYDDDGYLPQVSDKRVRFSPFPQEARYGFPCKADKNFPKMFRIEIYVGVKRWLNRSPVFRCCLSSALSRIV
jgi:hypothetical protein